VQRGISLPRGSLRRRQRSRAADTISLFVRLMLNEISFFFSAMCGVVSKLGFGFVWRFFILFVYGSRLAPESATGADWSAAIPLNRVDPAVLAPLHPV
jgi:hypothetical protein